MKYSFHPLKEKSGITDFKAGTSIDQKGPLMSATPNVKRITLQQDIVSVCREFLGPYENVKEYVTEVESYLGGIAGIIIGFVHRGRFRAAEFTL